LLQCCKQKTDQIPKIKMDKSSSIILARYAELAQPLHSGQPVTFKKIILCFVHFILVDHLAKMDQSCSYSLEANARNRANPIQIAVYPNIYAAITAIIDRSLGRA
jgi:hypothetical protein